MEPYAGIDLHSSNNYTAVIDDQDQRLYGKRLPNRLNAVLSALEPFREILEGVVIESTYNWHWLVDGLKLEVLRYNISALAILPIVT